ncbi:MAG TPA: ABC transporter ATP-binding protein, partial [Candidatus Dormibacteraeota bacterium]|nr:ABC transporter ATP-binding protein [Candidatus Dormibacteraeota bacterium]
LELFHKRIGTTTIYVTHDQVEAMAMGDRVVVLHQGYVRQVGTPTEVYDEPADTFVATFLGSPPMNLLETPEVVVGVRPEHLLPADRVPASSRVPLRFKIAYMEYLGAERILYGSLVGSRFAEKEVISRIPTTISAAFRVDEAFDFGVAAENLRFFDRQTEKRTEPRAIDWQ